MAPGIDAAVRALAIATVLAGGHAVASEPAAQPPQGPGLTRAEGLLVFDYQKIPLAGGGSIDLKGIHVLQRLADGLYVGVGAHAPLVSGAYGGFMAFDGTVHLQRPLWGRLFANAGVSLGGGGGGRSREQSRFLSGTGAFAKAYAGLGHDFGPVAVGANIAWMKFERSAIDHSQLDLFVQVPFGYTVGPFARAGSRVTPADDPASFGDGSETTLTLGLDNFVQVDPVGTVKGTIRIADLQYAHFLTDRVYWYASLGVGYRGLPLYNQLIGGVGYRHPVAPRISLHGQLGVGSGGWSPEDIDTGPGLLVYPKVSAELALTRRLGLSLSAGYLVAPKGSSKNKTYGLALNYRIRTHGKSSADDAVFTGHRFSLYPQVDFNLRYRGIDRPRVDLLSGQLDTIVGDHLYIPVKGSIAAGAYLDYPGYGELLAGVGVQSAHAPGRRMQFFGQLLGGANVHGLIVQAGVGLNVALSDRLALYASIGRTRSVRSGEKAFSTDYAGAGLTYRFSIPSR